MSLYCSAAKTNLNPEKGVPLAGYKAERPAEEAVHDNLYARITVFTLNKTCLIIIHLDLICVDYRYVNELRKKINEKHHIPKENVMVHASHTHSGPGGIIHRSSPVYKAFSDVWKTYDRTTVKQQHQKIMKAVDRALATTERCELTYGTGMAPGIASNRIDPDRYYVPELNVLSFEKQSGGKVLLYHFACHPTVLHAGNFHVSADFPGAASYALEQMEEVETAIFLNGPSGDISTRFTRRESTFSEVSRIGKKLAGYVQGILRKSEQIPVSDLSANNVFLQLPTRQDLNKTELIRNLEEAKQKYEKAVTEEKSKAAIRSAESEIEGLTAAKNLSDRLEGIEMINCELQVMSIGNSHFAAVPGEMYGGDGRKITGTFPGIHVLGNTNDYIGYIVPECHYDEGSYEASMTLLEKGSAEKLIRESRKLILKHMEE